ncbi:MAG: S41 family peptidase, partial [Simkaniaceae bacterium]|nr:S41 family peptidase [Simkaniaceae bacterium]
MLATFLKAFTASLDAHTAYFTPSEAKQFMIQVQQRLFGIGAQLRDDLNGLTIVRFLDGSPALDLLNLGDRIVAVNNEPIVGLDIVDAVDLIRGPQGTSVILTILREGEKHEISIVRDEIVLKESRFDKAIEPFGDGVIAHLSLYSFYQDPAASSASDLRQAIEEIRHQHKLKGVILDIRNNGGGLLNQAVAVTGLFIKKGIVASVKDHTGKVHHLRNFDGDVAWDGPLFVLINKTSASSSEIVGQALQDYGRALVIGDDHSFGKGTYQSFTIESAHENGVSPQGEYKVTRGLYYTVSGKSPQLHGVKSDLVVPGLFSGTDIGESIAKFPLEPDTINPNFEDTLSDIHPLHRFKMKRLYQNNLQEPLQIYDPYIERLKENSTLRIEKNLHYQHFLELIKNDEKIGEVADLFKKSDLQLDEAKNIMKDLIFLRQATASPAPYKEAS